jgi:recombination protein RecA
VEFDILYGHGISKLGELVDLGVKAEVVDKSGSWYSFESERIGQGRENARQFLADNPDISARIENAIRANAGLIASEMLQPPEDGEESEAEAG